MVSFSPLFWCTVSAPAWRLIDVMSAQLKGGSPPCGCSEGLDAFKFFVKQQRDRSTVPGRHYCNPLALNELL